MNGLTTEQRVCALRWAADYLEQHGEQRAALESLRHCADMTEKYGIPDSIGVNPANGSDSTSYKPLQASKKP